jgi:hypothetical protein
MTPRFINPALQVWPADLPVSKGRALDRLAEDLHFETSRGVVITIPAGFTSDGGSVPWWGRWLVNPSHNQRAWWVHDWAWDNDRADHGRLLNEALIADDCPWLHRHCIVIAVKIAGALKLKGIV